MADLNRNQRSALAALLATTSVREAAELAGLGERTIYRYLSDPAFKAELQERQDQILASTTATMIGLTDRALADFAMALRVLREQAIGDVGDFIELLEGGAWRLDLEGAQEAGRLGLIKKLWVDGQEHRRLELYDRQAAAEKLGRLVLGLLDETRRQQEVDQLTERVAALEKAAGIKG